MRLPLLTIFWAIFWIATCKKGISALELQRKVGIKSYQTAWTLGHKIRKAMRSSDQYPIDEDVELDDTFLGLTGKSETGNRARINVVVETPGPHIRRSYLEHLQTYSSAVIVTILSN